VEGDLAHMGNVEQRSLRSGVQVLRNYTLRKLQGHLVSGERHHFGAKFNV
jgi:hypothetical protein